MVPTNANQANIQPVYEVYANVQDRDLGSVADDDRRVVAELQKQLSPGNTIQVTGQIESMNGAFHDMGIGLLFAAVFVYLLMVVNYQNFGDPFVVILALPATFCGIVTMLLHHRHDVERAFADGRDHGGRRRLGKFDPARDLCARAAARRHHGLRCGDRRRSHPHPAGADDCRGDDRRHDPDGDRRLRARSRTPRWRAPSSAACCSRRRPRCSSFLTCSPMLRKGNDGKPAHGVFDGGFDE